MSVSEIPISSWHDLLSHSQPGWIFRGQREASWDLETSFDRLCRRVPITTIDRSRVEEALIRDFKRSFHQYSANVPEPNARIEWLSLMQHHGAPSRLLDFSYSLYVASYFALEDAEEAGPGAPPSQACVWAINLKWALNTAATMFAAAGKTEARRLLTYLDRDAETVYQQLLFDTPFLNGAIPINPFRLNERLRIQKGIFLVPGDLSHTVMNNLLAMPGCADPANVKKLVIPTSLRSPALQELHYMNVTRTSLFPGLDGFAQSMARFHHAFLGKATWE